MSDVKFITRNGLKSAKKAARHEIDGFLELVYFKEEVLKKYESNKDFQIGDNGTVLFGYKWGLFRGVFRVAKGFIAANLGDLGEGLPTKELEHWKKYNVNSTAISKSERYFDFRNTIKRMIYFMELSNKRIVNHIDRFYSDIPIANKELFNLKEIETILNHLKKVINEKTTIDEFQSRIIFLNILLIDSINLDLIHSIFKKIDTKLLYSNETLGLIETKDNYLKSKIPEELNANINTMIHPLRSLESLRKFLLILKLNHDLIISLKIRTLGDSKKHKKKIYAKISCEFYNNYKYFMYKTNFQNEKYFTFNYKKIAEDTNFLKLLNKFRSGSAAHGFSKKEYNKILHALGLNENLTDYSVIYETLISKVSYDIEHIYFNLISPDPPIIDFYKEYMSKSLMELGQTTKYESTFEDIASYLSDFPELYPKVRKSLNKIHSKKKVDKDFIVQLGCFIESISHNLKDKTQELINWIIEGYKYEKPLALAHLSHIIKNSEIISDSFFDKSFALVKTALTKDKEVTNVDFCAQHVIFCFAEKCKEKLSIHEVKELLTNRKSYFGIEKILNLNTTNLEVQK